MTRENVARNGLTARVRAGRRVLGSITERYPLVVANTHARTLVQLALPWQGERWRPADGSSSAELAPEAAPTQLDDVKKAYASKFDEVRRKGEWIAMVLR